MAFSLPTFNVHVNVWHTGSILPAFPPVGLPSFTVLGNVSLGRRVMTGTDSEMAHDVRLGLGIDILMRQLMVPAGTDIRAIFQNEVDQLEVPAGSGAFYKVVDVADVAKGFANEHRMVWFVPNLDGVNFLPIPLP